MIDHFDRVAQKRLLLGAELQVGCFRNLLLVTVPQHLFAKVLAPDFELREIAQAKFGCNLLLPKALH